MKPPIGSFAPYGLQFRPTVRNRLATDEKSAAVVRRIFDMTLQGMGSTAIARLLNSESVLTPGAYFRQKLYADGSHRIPARTNQPYRQSMRIFNKFIGELGSEGVKEAV